MAGATMIKARTVSVRKAVTLLAAVLAVALSTQTAAVSAAATTTATDVSASVETAAATETPITEDSTATGTAESEPTETGTEDAATTTAVEGVTDLFNTRYCEILPFTLLQFTQPNADGNGSTTTNITMQETYNTLGYNDCPEDLWSEVTVDSVDEEYGSYSATINGPRWWTMDGIVGSGGSKSGPTFTFNGIDMERRAIILMTPEQSSLPHPFYETNPVQRSTTYTFNAGTQVFELTDPEGNEYIMQSYTTMVDDSLTIDTLPNLGDMLDLPEGWSFASSVLEEDYQLSTVDNVAQVLQDNFLNTYQMKPAASS